MDCVNNLQSLMNSCRDVSNNDTYDEIYQKVADIVSPEEISIPRIVKHQTMRSNAPEESPKNYYTGQQQNVVPQKSNHFPVFQVC